MSLRTAVAATLSHSETMGPVAQEIAATLTYTTGATAEGTPDEVWLSLLPLVEAMQNVLATGFAQGDVAGTAAVIRPMPNSVKLTLRGDALSPNWVAYVVRLLAQLHHAPYHPLMEITGAQPVLYDTVVQSVQISITPPGDQPLGRFLGLDPLPSVSAKVPASVLAATQAGVVTASRLHVSDFGPPGPALENDLLILAGAFMFQPLDTPRGDEPELFADASGGLSINGLVMDQAALMDILAILPRV